MTLDIAYKVYKEENDNNIQMYFPALEDAGLSAYTSTTDSSNVESAAKEFAASALKDKYTAGNIKSFIDGHLSDESLCVCTITDSDFS